MAERRTLIYFARAGEAVKIGYASNLERRLSSIQTGCPLPVRVFRTAPGGLQEERWLHQRFQARRLHGEWFRYTPEMLTVEIDPPGDFYRFPRALSARLGDLYASADRPHAARADAKAEAAFIISSLTRDLRALVDRSPHRTARGRIIAVAHLLRLPVTRVGDWYYGEVRRVELFEADQIRHFAAMLNAPRVGIIRPAEAEQETVSVDE